MTANNITWILNESFALQAHAVAVANAVGLPVELKRLERTGLLSYLPISLQMQVDPARLLASVSSFDASNTRFPRLIIAAGRKSVPLALSMKSVSATPVFVLRVQRRFSWTPQFDLVVSPMRNNILEGTHGFDAIYNVSMAGTGYESYSGDPSGDVDLVARVIRRAIGLENHSAVATTP